jgi:DNA (cytosine-5)-methyltransferase 1
VNVLDLFSGIGGFSLGLERAGMRTVAFCEIDHYCQRVLARHWPGVPIFGDIRRVGRNDIGGAVEVICGGFPCQDISIAGRGAGIEGDRSGLWVEFARLIGEIRPRWVIVENVSALLVRGLDRVLGDLAALRYDAEWYCIPASAVGAPHERDRLWIVAYPNDGQRERPEGEVQAGRDAAGARREAVADAESLPERPRLRESIAAELWRRRPGNSGSAGSNWPAEPDVGRVANGVPARVDRLKGLGNAVVPQIPELIGRAIMEVERAAMR